MSASSSTLHPPAVHTHHGHNGADDDDDQPESPESGKVIEGSRPSSPVDDSEIHETPFGGWSSASYLEVNVRGPTYLQSKHKINARLPLLEVAEVEVLTSKERLANVADRHDSPILKWNGGKVSNSAKINELDPSTFTFVINFMVPQKDNGVYVVMYFRHRSSTPINPADYKHYPNIDEKRVRVNNGKYVDPQLESSAIAAALLALKRFIHTEDDHYRDTRLKFIPRIVEGPWLVKKAVGTKPAIIGMKLKQSYHSNPGKNYYEVDIDVSSASAAASIYSVVKGQARNLIIDLSFLMEGQEVETLPEVLLAAARIIHIDVEHAKRL